MLFVSGHGGGETLRLERPPGSRTSMATNRNLLTNHVQSGNRSHHHEVPQDGLTGILRTLSWSSVEANPLLLLFPPLLDQPPLQMQGQERERGYKEVGGGAGSSSETG